MKKIEYRVRAKTVYHVTRFTSEESPSGACSIGSESYGMFDNLAQAEWIALCLKYADDKLGDSLATAKNLEGSLMHPKDVDG